jgi:hypothetical protein
MEVNVHSDQNKTEPTIELLLFDMQETKPQ